MGESLSHHLIWNPQNRNIFQFFQDLLPAPISHDVHFIRTLAETTLHINNGNVTRYTGGYDYFIEKSGLNDDRSAVTA